MSAVVGVGDRANAGPIEKELHDQKLCPEIPQHSNDDRWRTPFIPNDTSQDHFLGELYAKGLINAFGRCILDVGNYPFPPLEHEQIEQVLSFLHTTFEIRIGDHAEARILHIPVFHILEFLKGNSTRTFSQLDIVGGFLRALLLLSPEYCRKALQLLGVEDVDSICTEELFDDSKRKLPDYDLRIWVPGANKGDLCQFTQNLVKYFSSKIQGSTEYWVRNKAFSKFKLVFERRNQFTIAAFGNKVDSEVELLFVSNLERNHLFLQDALSLNILECFSSNEKLTESLRFQSDYHGGWQSLIDLLGKVIHVDHLETIDHLGFLLLISYISRGYVLGDVEVGGQNVLKALIKKTTTLSSNYGSVPSQVVGYLASCVRNHHQSDPLAAITVAFNACIYLESSLTKSEIDDIWREMDLRFLNISSTDYSSNNFVLNIAARIVRNNIPFEIVNALMILGSFFRLGMPKSEGGK